MSEFLDCMLCAQDADDAARYMYEGSVDGRQQDDTKQEFCPPAPPFCQVCFMVVCVLLIFGVIVALGMKWV